MDTGSRKSAGRGYGYELTPALRRAVELTRGVPPPAGSLSRALEQARRWRVFVPAWFRGLLRGDAGQN